MATRRNVFNSNKCIWRMAESDLVSDSYFCKLLCVFLHILEQNRASECVAEIKTVKDVQHDFHTRNDTGTKTVHPVKHFYKSPI